MILKLLVISLLGLLSLPAVTWADEGAEDGKLYFNLSLENMDKIKVEEASKYFKSQLQNIIDTARTIYGGFEYERSASLNSWTPAMGFELGMFYKFHNNFETGLKLESLDVLNSTYGTGVMYPPAEFRGSEYKYCIISKLIPIMASISYSSNNRQGLYYSAILSAGVGIHTGTLELKQLNYEYGFPSVTFDKTTSFSSVGFIGEASARLGYNFTKYFGVFGEVGYLFAPIKTQITDMSKTTSSSITLGETIKKDVMFDMSTLVYKLGILVIL
jgi:hypothetical protein